MNKFKFRTGDIVVKCTSPRLCSLVRVGRCTSKAVKSYIIPGRKKPIAPAGEEFLVISDTPRQEAAERLFNAGKTEFTAEDDIRRAITEEVT